MGVEEVCYTEDKHNDDAYVGGLEEVTLVHGKGTGILRKATNKMLRNIEWVRSKQSTNMYCKHPAGIDNVKKNFNDVQRLH